MPFSASLLARTTRLLVREHSITTPSAWTTPLLVGGRFTASQASECLGRRDLARPLVPKRSTTPPSAITQLLVVQRSTMIHRVLATPRSGLAPCLATQRAPKTRPPVTLRSGATTWGTKTRLTVLKRSIVILLAAATSL